MKFSKKIMSALAASLVMISSAAVANPVVATFTDLLGQGLDPGSFGLVDEHGQSAARGGVFTLNDYAWFDTQSYDDVTKAWTVTIHNESTDLMHNTVLALETGTFNLAPTSWDGVVGSDPAYYFGDIGAGMTATRTIYVTSQPDWMVANSLGLDTTLNGTNVSILHDIPEPGSVGLASAALGVMAWLGNRRRV